MKENWKKIEGFEGLYEVSDFGRVRSLPREIRRGKGYFPRSIIGKILSTNKKGYTAVQLCSPYGMERHLLHRLVAKAFIKNPQNLPFVNHKDGDKTNNKASNLEWCTARDNTRHAIRTGLRGPTGAPPGERNGRAVLSAKDVT